MADSPAVLLCYSIVIALPYTPVTDSSYNLLQDKSHTLRSFAAYADWVKALHFSEPPLKKGGEGNRTSHAPAKKRRMFSYLGPEPTVEEIEAEFWRIVESPDDVSCSLWKVYMLT